MCCVNVGGWVRRCELGAVVVGCGVYASAALDRDSLGGKDGCVANSRQGQTFPAANPSTTHQPKPVMVPRNTLPCWAGPAPRSYGAGGAAYENMQSYPLWAGGPAADPPSRWHRHPGGHEPRPRPTSTPAEQRILTYMRASIGQGVPVDGPSLPHLAWLEGLLLLWSLACVGLGYVPRWWPVRSQPQAGGLKDAGPAALCVRVVQVYDDEGSSPYLSDAGPVRVYVCLALANNSGCCLLLFGTI